MKQTRLALTTLPAVIALLLCGGNAANAQSSGYRFVYLDSSDINGSATLWGVGDNDIVGQGVTVGDYSHASFAWDLQAGTRFLLDGGASGAQVRGATGDQAVGVYLDSDYNSFAVAWNLPTNTMRFLDNSGLVGVSAQAATNGYAVGYGGVPGQQTSAYAWNLGDGTRTLLDKTGLSYSGAIYAGEGYAIGEGQGTATGNAYKPMIWEVASNTRTILNTTGLTGTYTHALTNGYAVGAGSGVATNYESKLLRWNLQTNQYATFDTQGVSAANINGAGAGLAVGDGRQGGAGNLNRALAWDVATGTRRDLQAFMPGTINESHADRIGDDGTIAVYWGITDLNTYSGIGGHAALVPFTQSGADDFVLGLGETATTATNAAQSGGVTTINGDYRVQNGANPSVYTLTGGTLKGSGTLAAGTFAMLGGTLAPGNSPGTLSLVGDFAMSGGTYAVEIAGTNPGDFDVLAVTGAATFTGGTFAINYLAGYAPTTGDFFDVITTTAGMSGASLVSVPSGWAFTQNGNNGRLSFTGVAVVPEANTGLLAWLAGFPAIGYVAARRKH